VIKQRVKKKINYLPGKKETESVLVALGRDVERCKRRGSGGLTEEELKLDFFFELNWKTVMRST